MKRTVVIALTLLFIISPIPAYALEPPDDITIPSVVVVRNTAEEGDMAFVFYFNTEYDTYPDDIPASEAVILRIYDTDGETLLRTGSPYTLFDSGYGPQVSDFYFSADDVEDLELSWGESYVISITYSEAFLESPPEKPYVLSAADYCSPEDREANQTYLTAWVLSRCGDLEAARPDYVLRGTTDVATVLTEIGELYFRGAIPGLQSMAPSLFFLQFITPEPITIEYTANMTEVYAPRLQGTEIMTGFERIGAKAGVTGDFALAMFFFVVAIGMIIFTAHKGWGAEPGLMSAGNWLTMGALLAGNMVMVLRFVLAFIAAIMLFYVLLFRRA